MVIIKKNILNRYRRTVQLNSYDNLQLLTLNNLMLEHTKAILYEQLYDIMGLKQVLEERLG